MKLPLAFKVASGCREYFWKSMCSQNAPFAFCVLPSVSYIPRGSYAS
jgi:hypothetical protein